MLGRLLRGLPWFLAVVHAIFTVAIFWYSLAHFHRAYFLPVYVSVVDLPASILIDYADALLGYVTRSEGNYLLTGVMYLIFGSLWWFWIGRGTGALVNWVRTRFNR
jgi:hypothetical protein